MSNQSLSFAVTQVRSSASPTRQELLTILSELRSIASARLVKEEVAALDAVIAVLSTDRFINAEKGRILRKTVTERSRLASAENGRKHTGNKDL